MALPSVVIELRPYGTVRPTHPSNGHDGSASSALRTDLQRSKESTNSDPIMQTSTVVDR